MHIDENHQPPPGRRRFLRGLALAGGALLVGGCAAGYAYEIEPRRLAPEQVQVPLALPSRALHGLRISTRIYCFHYFQQLYCGIPTTDGHGLIGRRADDSA